MRPWSALLVACFAFAAAQDIFLEPARAAVDEVFPPPSPPPGQPEVLIIGAGWAGMGAAMTLAKANVSFQVLEARKYTGGRTHAIPFGDPAVWRGVWEEGSNWICGCQKGAAHDKNPVCALANKVGLAMHEDDDNYRDVGYDAEGHNGDPDGKISRASDAAVDCISAIAAKRKTKNSENVRQALNTCGWKPKTGMEQAFDWLITVDEAGMPADEQSLKMEFDRRLQNESLSSLGHPIRRARGRWARKRQIKSPHYSGDWQFVTDQNPRGFAKLIDEMTKDTVPPGDKRVLFNKAVSKIAYSTTGVQATTTDGSVYKAAATIVTLPYGVLMREHKAMFHPPLPSDLTKIIDGGRMVMTNETKVFIQFPKVFWNNSVNQFVASPAHGEPVGNFCEFLNLNHKDNVPGSNTLLVFLGDPESSKYEAMDDASVQKAFLVKLAQIYPNATIPKPSAFHITRWGQDPFARGSYSGFHPGFDDDEYETLMTPVMKKRVYLAGEAMCDDMSGFTHGGRQSGVQNAQSYLHATGRGSKPEDLCWA